MTRKIVIAIALIIAGSIALSKNGQSTSIPSIKRIVKTANQSDFGFGDWQFFKDTETDTEIVCHHSPDACFALPEKASRQ